MARPKVTGLTTDVCSLPFRKPGNRKDRVQVIDAAA